MKKSLMIFAIAFALNAVAAAPKTVELFNGENLEGWSFVLDPAKNAVASDVFSVKDGLINIKGQPFGYMYTQSEYENFTFYAEWRWPEKPTNSGMFMFVQDAEFWPNCIEVQLCAGKAGDFVLMKGADMKEYKLPADGKRPKFPVINRFAESSENKAGEWNSALITCKDGVITVFINGVFQNKGTASMNKKGRIALQSEGGPIQFRNVRLTVCE